MAHEHAQCSKFAAAMDVLAKPWTGLLIVTLEQGPLRFSEIGQRAGAIGDRMLSVRLRELEMRGLVVRSVVPGPPVKVEYALTEVGRGFHEVAAAMSKWGSALLEAQARSAKESSPRRRRTA